MHLCTPLSVDVANSFQFSWELLCFGAKPWLINTVLISSRQTRVVNYPARVLSVGAWCPQNILDACDCSTPLSA